MPTKFIYAGIGSRETPFAMQKQMANIALQLAPNWILRSGHADGADKAFEFGCINGTGQKEIFLPWEGFNGAPKGNPEYGAPPVDDSRYSDIAAKFHPCWNSCSRGAKAMHTRNVCQVLGADLNTPANMVVCWTKDGRGQGGTGQALRIAKHHNVPIFDLAIPGMDKAMCDFIITLENQS